MTAQEWMVAALWAITPTALVGVLFWFTFRSVLRADRSERRARKSAQEAEEARFEQRYGAPPERAVAADAEPGSTTEARRAPGA